MNRKEELQKIIDDAREELYEIEEKEEDEHLKTLVGKCFICKEYIGSPDNPSSSWLVYHRIHDSKEYALTSWSFNTPDYNGEITIDFRDLNLGNYGEEISEEAFYGAWVDLLKYMGDRVVELTK